MKDPNEPEYYHILLVLTYIFCLIWIHRCKQCHLICCCSWVPHNIWCTPAFGSSRRRFLHVCRAVNFRKPCIFEITRNNAPELRENALVTRNNAHPAKPPKSDLLQPDPGWSRDSMAGTFHILNAIEKHQQTHIHTCLVRKIPKFSFFRLPAPEHSIIYVSK